MKIARWTRKSLKTKEENTNLQKAWLVLFSKWFLNTEKLIVIWITVYINLLRILYKDLSQIFIVLFCKLTFIRLASHMNKFPVSTCCLLNQIIGILMTILKVQVLGLDCAVPTSFRHWISVEAFPISDSNSNYKSKFWI